MSISTEQIAMLAEKYRGSAILWGVELLLPPHEAIALLKELAVHGEMVVGCDGWRYIDNDPSRIVQDLGVDLWVEDEITWEEMTPSRNVAVLLPLLAGIPDNIDLISLQLNDVTVQDDLMDALREHH